MASLVSALNLHKECPSTLLNALANSHPDQEVWLQSYKEEKSGLESLNTYRKLALGKYRALCKKGAPCAIPTMCVITIKQDENLLPQCAKSHIVVLGNHKDRVWSKSDSGVTLSISLSAWPSNNVALFIKVIARMHFA